jgi:hypothetical protein
MVHGCHRGKTLLLGQYSSTIDTIEELSKLNNWHPKAGMTSAGGTLTALNPSLPAAAIRWKPGATWRSSHSQPGR